MSHFMYPKTKMITILVIKYFCAIKNLLFHIILRNSFTKEWTKISEYDFISAMNKEFQNLVRNSFIERLIKDLPIRPPAAPPPPPLSFVLVMVLKIRLDAVLGLLIARIPAKIVDSTSASKIGPRQSESKIHWSNL